MNNSNSCERYLYKLEKSIVLLKWDIRLYNDMINEYITFLHNYFTEHDRTTQEIMNTFVDIKKYINSELDNLQDDILTDKFHSIKEMDISKYKKNTIILYICLSYKYKKIKGEL